jgi:CheY-like chemotaxis protein
MESILIVEDESVIRSALRKLLEHNDYSVTEADSVAAAQRNNLESWGASGFVDSPTSYFLVACSASKAAGETYPSDE